MKNTIKFTLAAMAAIPMFFTSCSKETAAPASDGTLEARSYTCEPQCWQEETAWGEGCRYTKKGNWAMYTKYDKYACIPLIAGQNHYAGSITFSCVNNGKVTITIQLANGWELAEGSEVVKIQGYNSAPSGNPAPGKFNTYKGRCLTVEVDAYCFYGIHVDVRKAVSCD